jgi:hypothetical protein
MGSSKAIEKTLQTFLIVKVIVVSKKRPNEPLFCYGHFPKA